MQGDSIRVKQGRPLEPEGKHAEWLPDLTTYGDTATEEWAPWAQGFGLLPSLLVPGVWLSA